MISKHFSVGQPVFRLHFVSVQTGNDKKAGFLNSNYKNPSLVSSKLNCTTMSSNGDVIYSYIILHFDTK